MTDPAEPFLRHIRACHNADLPATRRRFLLAGQHVGWMVPAIAEAAVALGARASGSAVALDDPAALPGMARSMADRGLLRWRGEAFDVRADPDGPVLSQIDRGALPAFGVLAVGVHVNGLVRRADGLHVWVARRSTSKHLDPGKLDHLVAGGVPAGLTPEGTVVKEAAEEAAVPAALARSASTVATLSYAMERPEGLRRDRLVCFDLDLPEDFSPVATDGEVESFALWPLHRAYDTVRDTDDFKFNVSLVLIDLFLRTGLIEPESTGGRRVRAALDAAAA